MMKTSGIKSGVALIALIAIGGCASTSAPQDVTASTGTGHAEATTSNDYETLLASSQQSMRAQEIELARQRAEQAMAMQPERPEAILLAGDIEMTDQNYDEAETLYTNVTSVSPTPEAQLRRAVTLLNMDEPEAAIALLQEIRPAEPINMHLLTALGTAHGMAGEPEAANRVLVEALAIDPSYALAHSNTALSQLRAGDREKALKTFNEQIGFAPDAKAALYNLRLINALEGDYRRALDELSGHNLFFLSNSTAIIAALNGDYAQSLAILEQVINLSAPRNKTGPQDDSTVAGQ